MRWLRILFSFKGRIGRGTYWLANIGLLASFVGIGMLTEFSAELVGHAEVNAIGGPALQTLSWIHLLLAIWAVLAIEVKRWHDRGKSGLWLLIGLVPVVGRLWKLVELGFLEGEAADNPRGYGATNYATRT